MGESKISLKYDPKNAWSYAFAVGNRDILKKNGIGQLKVLHIELTHFTSYHLNSNNILSLGIRYRFKKAFKESRDEFRIMQQYIHSWNFKRTEISNRFRLEERFRKEISWRGRLKLSIKQLLGTPGRGRKELYLGAGTESLYSLEKNLSPILDQRVEINLEYEILNDIRFKLGTQKRWKNYLKQLSSEYYIYSQLKFQI